MLLLGLDPGGQTGFALVQVEGNLVTLLSIGQFSEREKLPNLVAGAHRVIFESFQIGPRSAAGTNLISLEVIGAIKSLCELNSIPWISQTPSQRRFIQIRHPEWTKPFEGKTHAVSHGGDALMHVLTYCYHHLKVRKFQP